MSAPTLFIALSTGQNIANLLPILERAEPQDHVLWIESATAHQRGWSAGALDVLSDQGVGAIQVETLDDDLPSSVDRLLRTHPLVQTGLSIALIGNGGTKLQMLAAHQALAGRIDALLYNQDHHCAMAVYQGGPAGPVSEHPYRRHGIDLAEVLRCRGTEPVPGTGTRIWPGPAVPAATGFAIDREYTARRHDAVSRHARRQTIVSPRPTRYDDAAALAPQQLRSFRRGIAAAMRQPPEAAPEPRLCASAYYGAFKLDEQARIQARRQQAPSPSEIGPELENAVAVRVLGWLARGERAVSGVQSVWRNVKVRRIGDSTALAELDILFVLRNAVLLHLECKSFDADLKDMDARLAVLQRSTSQLARMAICLPRYTDLPTSDWGGALAQKVDKVLSWSQFPLLGLTFPGQPTHMRDARGVEQRVPAFEDALARWLSPFAEPAP